MRKVNCSMKTKVTALERQVTFKGNEVKLGLERITLEDEGGGLHLYRSWSSPSAVEKLEILEAALQVNFCKKNSIELYNQQKRSYWS